MDWSMVGAVAGIFGVIAVIVTRAQRQRKVLEYRVYRSPVARVDHSVADRMQIIFDGHKVESVEYTLIGLESVGNAAVAPDDFVAPLSIPLEENQLLLGVTIALPDGSKVQPSLDQRPVALPAMLLNPGDRCEVTLIVAPYWKESPIPRARIIDGSIVPAPMRMAASEKSDMLFGLATIATAVSTLVLSNVFAPAPPFAQSVVLALCAFALVCLIVLKRTRGQAAKSLSSPRSLRHF
jgi:hypothetical protein